MVNPGSSCKAWAHCGLRNFSHQPVDPTSQVFISGRSISMKQTINQLPMIDRFFFRLLCFFFFVVILENNFFCRLTKTFFNTSSFLIKIVSPQATPLSIAVFMINISSAPPWGTWLRTHFCEESPAPGRIWNRDLLVTRRVLCHCVASLPPF